MSERTMAETAFDVIRTRIESGELPGGTHLTLIRLSGELGMSHTPVREALRMLQTSGLVGYRPHTGHVVTAYSVARAEEIYLLRRALEPLAARLAGQRADPQELEIIAQLDDDFQRAVETAAAPALLVEANMRWHRAVHSAAGVGLLEEFTDRLWRGVPYQAIWFVGRSHASAAAHRAITAALLDGRPEDAERGMLAHIRAGERATLEHLVAIGAPAA